MLRKSGIIILFFLLSTLTFRTAHATNTETFLKEMVSGKRNLSSLNIKYIAGDPTFHGQTSLEIEGKGKATVIWKQRGKKMSYKGKITSEKIKTILEILIKDKIWSVTPPKKPYLPDTSIVRLNLSTKENDFSKTITFAEPEALTNKNTKGTYLLFRLLIKKLSGGKVKY